LSGSGTGGLRRTVALKSDITVTFAVIASASVITTDTKKAGLRNKPRKASFSIRVFYIKLSGN